MDIKIEDLEFGDVLLYSGTGFFSRLIKIKTWSRLSHVEIYAGGGTTIASRDGIGVDKYKFTNKNLRAVLRPSVPPELDQESGWDWFVREAWGQPYDWVGLLAFFSAKFQGASRRAMFCSEFACRFLKKCKYPIFAGDSDAISPGAFWTNAKLELIWLHPEEKNTREAE